MIFDDDTPELMVENLIVKGLQLPIAEKVLDREPET